MGRLYTARRRAPGAAAAFARMRDGGGGADHSAAAPHLIRARRCTVRSSPSSSDLSLEVRALGAMLAPRQAVARVLGT
jgi:hypothetical protein